MSIMRRKRITVGFVALGCPKNMVDSERMLAEVAKAGFLIVSDPNEADVIVINTCGFIAPAEAESLEAIKSAVDSKIHSGKRRRKVIVAGCLSERLGRQIFDRVDGIDALVGLGQRDNIAQIIEKTLASKEPAVFLEQTQEMTAKNIHDDRTRLLITPGHWAYLRISEGCNRRCSFCTIPSIRGPFRSKPPELVLAEAKELLSAGVVELNLIAQDTTYYGSDLKIQDGLASLLKQLEQMDSLEWIRLMYSYPAGIDDKLIEVISSSKKILHYLDIPIQHVSDSILKSMRRPDTKSQLFQLIEKLRSAIPDIVLRTTMIVGFPGETDRQFDELLEFIKWAQFDALGCFTFYPESGTDAALLPDQVPEKIKQKRLDELMLCQQEIAFSKNRNRIGREITCLVDSINDDDFGTGRFYGQAPDIDSICIIEMKNSHKKNISLRPGQFINAKVTGTRDYDLVIKRI